jgi:hypothetical protein
VINYLRKRWQKALGFLQRLLRRERPLQVRRVEELPDLLDRRHLYVAGEGLHLWFAAFLCPCGCGATVQLSLMLEGRPRWQLSEHPDGTATLTPSVWRTKGCRSHFWVRRGRIEWVPTGP